MLRTSNIILHLRNSRAELSKASSACRIYIEDGKPSREFNREINEQILSSTILEENLKQRIAKLSQQLKGFDKSVLDPITFISSYDMKHKVVDLVKGTTYVGYLDLNTCEIHLVREDKSNTQSRQQRNCFARDTSLNGDGNAEITESKH